MSQLDVSRYRSIQSGAIARGDEGAAWLSAQGAGGLWFSGTGGALLLMEPAAALIARAGLRGGLMAAAEAPLTDDPRLRPGDVVVLPSLSGTTAETLAFAEWARARGAHVLALTAQDDSPLAGLASRALVSFAEDDTSCESFFLQSLLIARAALPVEDAARLPDAAALASLPEALIALKLAFEPEADRIAARLAIPQGAVPHLLTGAGNTWANAQYYGMCILEEMQWIPTRPIDSGLFFHGTLELMEEGTHLMAFRGSDRLTPLVDRVLRFARQRSEALTVLDAAQADLGPLTGQPDLAPVVLAALCERISDNLAERRDHPLTTRRYYRRMAY